MPLFSRSELERIAQRPPEERRCCICGDRSPLHTLCDNCNDSSNLYGAMAQPWTLYLDPEEVRDGAE